MPKLTYAFTSVCFTSNQYDNIESIIRPTAIAKMGFNRTWPRTLRYGSHLFGRLGLRKLETEALIKKIQALQSLMEKPEYLRLIMIALQWYQHIYGVSYPLLAIKKLFAEYGNSKWLNHFIKLLRKYNAHIKLKTFDLSITQRLHNIYIMDILTRNISFKTTLQRLNACRLFLQVTLLSKIGTTNGKDIQNNILKGKRKSIESNKLWPRQKFPDIATWKMWKSILKKNFFSYKNHLQSKFQLGSWDYLPS